MCSNNSPTNQGSDGLVVAKNVLKEFSGPHIVQFLTYSVPLMDVLWYNAGKFRQLGAPQSTVVRARLCKLGGYTMQRPN
jgi:hypothetical protein